MLGVFGYKNMGGNTQPLAQAEYVIGGKNDLNAVATRSKAADPWVAFEL